METPLAIMCALSFPRAGQGSELEFRGMKLPPLEPPEPLPPAEEAVPGILASPSQTSPARTTWPLTNRTGSFSSACQSHTKTASCEPSDQRCTSTDSWDHSHGFILSNTSFSAANCSLRQRTSSWQMRARPCCPVATHKIGPSQHKPATDQGRKCRA